MLIHTIIILALLIIITVINGKGSPLLYSGDGEVFQNALKSFPDESHTPKAKILRHVPVATVGILSAQLAKLNYEVMETQPQSRDIIWVERRQDASKIVFERIHPKINWRLAKYSMFANNVLMSSKLRKKCPPVFPLHQACRKKIKYLLLHSFCVPQKQFPRHLVCTFPSRIWNYRVQMADRPRCRSRADKGGTTRAAGKGEDSEMQNTVWTQRETALILFTRRLQSQKEKRPFSASVKAEQSPYSG